LLGENKNERLEKIQNFVNKEFMNQNNKQNEIVVNMNLIYKDLAKNELIAIQKLKDNALNFHNHDIDDIMQAYQST
jgi:hypothetical protein